MVDRSRVVAVEVKNSERTEMKLTDWTEREAEVILVANKISGSQFIY